MEHEQVVWLPGWAVRGQRAVSDYGILTDGDTYTILGFFDIEMGHVSHYTRNNTQDGNFGADAFCHGLVNSGLEHMTAYPGPRSVLVLDNWPGHKTEQIAEELGIVLEFPPPHVPDKMSHEYCGRTAKDAMRRAGGIRIAASRASSVSLGRTKSTLRLPQWDRQLSEQRPTKLDSFNVM